MIAPFGTEWFIDGRGDRILVRLREGRADVTVDKVPLRLVKVMQELELSFVGAGRWRGSVSARGVVILSAYADEGIEVQWAAEALGKRAAPQPPPVAPPAPMPSALRGHGRKDEAFY